MSSSPFTVAAGQVWSDGNGYINTVTSIDGSGDDLDSYVWLRGGADGAKFRVSVQTLVAFFAFVREA